MQAIKTIETKHNTYYLGYGCITNYEKTEVEKEEQRYMLIQKLIGILSIIIAALSLSLINIAPEIGLFTIIMSLIGTGLLLTKQRVICL